MMLLSQALIGANIVLGALNTAIYFALWRRCRGRAVLMLLPALSVLVGALWLALLEDGALGPLRLTWGGTRLVTAGALLACNVAYTAWAIRRRAFP